MEEGFGLEFAVANDLSLFGQICLMEDVTSNGVTGEEFDGGLTGDNPTLLFLFSSG